MHIFLQLPSHLTTRLLVSSAFPSSQTHDHCLWTQASSPAPSTHLSPSSSPTAVRMGWVFNAPDAIQTWGPQIAAICLVFTALSLALICLRVYVRTCLIKAFGAGMFKTTYTESIILIKSLR